MLICYVAAVCSGHCGIVRQPFPPAEIVSRQPTATASPRENSPFRHAKFMIGATEVAQLHVPVGLEVAFAGRSNSGKSSAINAITSRDRLAFVSKTPGRTQQINVFRVGESDRFLVDLPGYGYAKVAKTQRKHWDRVLSSYLQYRPTLVGLVLIMDARHPLTELDWQMLEWFAVSGRPVHVLLTKSDKLGKTERRNTLDAVNRELGGAPIPVSVQLFSSVDGTGLADAQDLLARWLGMQEPVTE
jgi:GTP-binding protein